MNKSEGFGKNGENEESVFGFFYLPPVHREISQVEEWGFKGKEERGEEQEMKKKRKKRREKIDEKKEVAGNQEEEEDDEWWRKDIG